MLVQFSTRRRIKKNLVTRKTRKPLYRRVKVAQMLTVQNDVLFNDFLPKLLCMLLPRKKCTITHLRDRFLSAFYCKLGMMELKF